MSDNLVLKNNSDFYKNLTIIHDLKEISDFSYYQEVPENWMIVATDVKNSTNAIEQGRYKDVNMIGALTIISILNLDRTLDIPFVFGGDGAFLLIPPDIIKESEQALMAVQRISADSYNLELRINMLPVNDIYSFNKKIFITKYWVTDEYSQAIIKGGGLEHCDFLMKTTDKYQVKCRIDNNFKVDFEGLECRWKNIPSPKDEVLSILIKSCDDNYANIIDSLEAIIGSHENRHPINLNHLELTFRSKDLSTEASAYSSNYLKKQLYIVKFKVINLIGLILMGFKVNLWKTYKNRIASSTDTEKFDDMLRMTVSATSEQAEDLIAYLEKEATSNKIIYGIHRADSSLITCLIFERHGKHIHFVDAAKGGYAMAAKMFKEQDRQ
jgi:hypothetical protein